MISQYPTQGVGFKVRQIDWPVDKYYKLTEVEQNSSRSGTIYGVLYEDNKRIDTLPVDLNEAKKRGMWIYDIADSNTVLDNGQVYKPADMFDFWRVEETTLQERCVDLKAETEEYMNYIEKKRLELKI